MDPAYALGGKIGHLRLGSDPLLERILDAMPCVTSAGEGALMSVDGESGQPRTKLCRQWVRGEGYPLAHRSTEGPAAEAARKGRHHWQ